MKMEKSFRVVLKCLKISHFWELINITSITCMHMRLVRTRALFKTLKKLKVDKT